MKSINIIVCIKPVPNPAHWDKLKMDPETMLLCREDIPPVINPLDKHALEQGLRLKEEIGGNLFVLTMAPPETKEQLMEALAMGCDEAYLLSDEAFAGADTLITAACLHAAIEKIGKFDLILCGGYSIDGSTAHVGPQLAELLAIPDLTHVTQLRCNQENLQVHCKLEDGYVEYEADMPLLLTFDKEANVPRIPNMTGIREAVDKEIRCWGAADIGLKPNKIGLKGSPTQMLNIFTPGSARKGEILKGSSNEMVTELITKLQKIDVIE